MIGTLLEWWSRILANPATGGVCGSVLKKEGDPLRRTIPELRADGVLACIASEAPR